MRFRTVLCMLSAVLGAFAIVDWPQWRGPNRDGIIPTADTQGAWPEKLKQVWKVGAGEGHSSPVVLGNRVYQFARVGDREVISAYDILNGKRLWSHGYAAPYEMNSAATGHGKGPKSTPVASEGRICTLGITGALTCLESASGKVLWSHAPLGDALYGTASSPIIDRGLLITPAGKHENGGVKAFAISDGKLRWEWKGDGPAYSSIVVGDFSGVRQAIVETENNIVSLNASTGELLWKIPLSSPYSQNSVTPVIAGDLVIYSAFSNPVVAVRPARRASGWTAPKVWENKEVGMYMNSPVIAGGLLYGLSHRNKGQFFALDLKTGRTVWTGEGRQADNAAMLAQGSTLFALTTDAQLLVMRAGPNGLDLLRKYEVASSPTWAHPVIAGRKVLIKDKESLALWSAD